MKHPALLSRSRWWHLARAHHLQSRSHALHVIPCKGCQLEAPPVASGTTLSTPPELYRCSYYCFQHLTGAVLLPEHGVDPSNTQKGSALSKHMQSASGQGAEPNSSAPGLRCCPVQAADASSTHFEAQICHCTWVKLAQNCIQGALLWPGLHGATLHDKPTPLPAQHQSSLIYGRRLLNPHTRATDASKLTA